MKKSIIVAGAASVALAAMPVVGVFAEDDRAVTDTITVTVDASCTFTAGGDDTSYAASGTNASGVVNPVNNSSNVHTFTVFCNNNSGYKVSATATDLTATGITDKFTYAATLPSSVDGAWNAAIAKTTESLTVNQIALGDTATDIVTLGAASAAGGETFTATYTAYIGTETPAGEYSGTIAYTLAPNA